jgi:hypothetical protein
MVRIRQHSRLGLRWNEYFYNRYADGTSAKDESVSHFRAEVDGRRGAYCATAGERKKKIMTHEWGFWFVVHLPSHARNP